MRADLVTPASTPEGAGYQCRARSGERAAVRRRRPVVPPVRAGAPTSGTTGGARSQDAGAEGSRAERWQGQNGEYADPPPPRPRHRRRHRRGGADGHRPRARGGRRAGGDGVTAARAGVDGPAAHRGDAGQTEPAARLRLPGLRVARRARRPKAGRVLRERRQGRRRGSHHPRGHAGVLRAALRCRTRRQTRVLALSAGPPHASGGAAPR